MESANTRNPHIFARDFGTEKLVMEMSKFSGIGQNKQTASRRL
jgi:hypothetical protein